MRPWRALLLFPARPAAAAAALPPAAALAAPGPPLFLLVYLAARGCRLPDAGLAAAGLLLVILGLGAGGWLASALARRIVAPDAPARGPHVHLVFAAWSATLFVAMLLVAGSALAAGLAVLVWGVVAGTGVVAGDTEPGRALVASCAGASGAILGVLGAGLLVHEHLVMVLPSDRGTMLVRRGDVGEPGALVLARDPASTTLFLARKGAAGLAPEAKPPPGPPAGWTVVGRVFFFFARGAPKTPS
ncbi:MAG TPA: hypothetical protein VFY93_03210 [Planctomycetota bacterium]|nr:hypothetical protein [Planctomycetota bacterium]